MNSIGFEARREQPGVMLFPHLLNRKSFVTEMGELDKFFLNLLQSFLPVAVSESRRTTCDQRLSVPVFELGS